MNEPEATDENQPLEYFASDANIKVPSAGKRLLSRIAFPLLSLLSREQSLKLGLTPIDDERVIMGLKNVKGYLLDVGCGANNFVRSYGNGVGVDVAAWEGVDKVVQDTADLPFDDATFDTVSYLACLNHIPNREDAVKEAYRLLKPGGQVMVTMIPPRMGAFIHWMRFRNDPDHQERHIDHAHELMGMAPSHVRSILEDAGFTNIRRQRFVYGMNSLYLADKPT